MKQMFDTSNTTRGETTKNKILKVHSVGKVPINGYEYWSYLRTRPL